MTLVAVEDVRPAGEWRLWVKFEDGVEGEVDVSDLRGKPMFRSLEDPSLFEAVYVHPWSKLVCWADNIELGSCGIYETLTHPNRCT